MRNGLCAAIMVMLVVLNTGGCVSHSCGPAYPDSTDPFCSIHWPPPPA